MAGNMKQMSVFTNNKSVIEFINKLKITTPGKGCKIHREDEKDEKGRKLPNSLVGINMVDYSANPSVFVQENITPSQLRELYSEAAMRRNNYTFSGNGEKIFGEPDKDGYSVVRVLKINRQGSFQKNGETIVKNYPWRISIENGKGIKEQNAKTGGFSCKKGSYKKEKEVMINMTDGDFFALCDKAVGFLNAWESAYASSFVKQTIEAIQKEEENYRRNGGSN